MFGILFFIFFSAFVSEEQETCFKSIRCSAFTSAQLSICTLCVESVYQKYKNLVPFTKKQVFDYIRELSCKDLRDKLVYYKVDTCVNQRM